MQTFSKEHFVGASVAAGVDAIDVRLHSGSIVYRMNVLDEVTSVTCAASRGPKGQPHPRDAWREVIGVVGDLRDDGIAKKPAGVRCASVKPEFVVGMLGLKQLRNGAGLKQSRAPQ